MQEDASSWCCTCDQGAWKNEKNVFDDRGMSELSMRTPAAGAAALIISVHGEFVLFSSIVGRGCAGCTMSTIGNRRRS